MQFPSSWCGDPVSLKKAISHHGDAGILAAAASSICWHGNRTEAKIHTYTHAPMSLFSSINKVKAACKEAKDVQTGAALPGENEIFSQR